MPAPSLLARFTEVVLARTLRQTGRAVARINPSRPLDDRGCIATEELPGSAEHDGG